MIEIGISLLLIIGTFFIFSASLGIIRFPDVFTRLHAASKSSTLGVASILIGAFLFMYFDADIVSGKLILGIIFMLLTAPVSAHMIARAAYMSGIELWEGSVKDDLAKKMRPVKEESK
ncbi:multicomponent Na+:H+ antiporter subunit G [Salirhabdus euzebyi]|uniref:Multicomponent Na+:H+ antiporter subunit G n=1 Tax=Salirhabdus euzebyi TaxID=394506 RepID=A0A841Q7I0_9BACI|nr:monovalent cation/H(+) antiporter subunit G [Salirhabdus euzebyi]MBB6454356.1 multicomponent Na+:H+ antiporter subunit G [Salirhabdus euzebyi]